MKKALLLLLFCCFINPVCGQKDTISQKAPGRLTFKSQVIPLGMISIGTALNYGNIKYWVRDKIGNSTNIRLDDYIQYAPIAEMYTADIVGLRHINTVFDQTKYLLISELITASIVQVIKYLTHVERPNGGPYAFPSGHTSQAFTGATVLYHEFKDMNKYFAYSGYLFSTSTELLRITNNRHWISDVLAGAGIGILVTNLIYHFEPLKNWKPFNSSAKAGIIPNLQYEDNGILLSMTIKL